MLPFVFGISSRDEKTKPPDSGFRLEPIRTCGVLLSHVKTWVWFALSAICMTAGVVEFETEIQTHETS